MSPECLALALVGDLVHLWLLEIVALSCFILCQFSLSFSDLASLNALPFLLALFWPQTYCSIIRINCTDIFLLRSS